MNFIKTVLYSVDLESKIKNLFDCNKVLVVTNLPNDINAEDYYTSLANQLGLLIKADEDAKTGAFIPNVWTKVKYIADMQYDTYKHSNQPQPMHTDYCYVSFLDALLLICDQQAEFGGATTFIDADVVVEILQKYNPSLLENLQKYEVQFGKRNNPIMSNLTKIIDKDEIGYKINWSKFRVSKDNSEFILSMAEEFSEFVHTYLQNSGLATEIILKKGEDVFINDERVLHGRNAFFGERCLLKGAIAINKRQLAIEKMAALKL